MISLTKRQYPRKDKLGKRHFPPKVKVQTSPKKVWLSMMDDEEVHYGRIKNRNGQLVNYKDYFNSRSLTFEG